MASARRSAPRGTLLIAWLTKIRLVENRLSSCWGAAARYRASPP
jgi:hypothetical protein